MNLKRRLDPTGFLANLGLSLLAGRLSGPKSVLVVYWSSAGIVQPAVVYSVCVYGLSRGGLVRPVSCTYLSSAHFACGLRQLHCIDLDARGVCAMRLPIFLCHILNISPCLTCAFCFSPQVLDLEVLCDGLSFDEVVQPFVVSVVDVCHGCLMGHLIEAQEHVQ
jgi:hypothetical protein